jgi:hypothetical protein
MNRTRSFLWITSLALAGCAPEVVDLVQFHEDAALDGAVEAPVEGEGESDAQTADTRSDASVGAELDARRPSFPDFDGSFAPLSCTGNLECGKYHYCHMTSCNGKRGTCMPRGSVCGPDQSAVSICGCDGNMYFNDCLRTQRGVNADPTCSLLRSCSSSSPCPDSTMDCSNLWDERSCRQGPPDRFCWVTPARCPQNTGGDQFVVCDSTGTAPASGDFCVSACEAIQSQLPFARTRCGSRGGPSGSSFTP